MFDPQLGEAAARQQLLNPGLDPADLAVIAGAFPVLAPQVAAHPALYPDLRDWLAALGRPDVDAALAPGPPEARVAPDQTMVAPDQAATVSQAAAAPSQDWAAASQVPPAPGQAPVAPGPASGPRPRRGLVLIVAGAAALALVVTVAVVVSLPKREGDLAGLAPNIAKQPRLGDVIDSRDVLDGDFENSSFAEALDGSTGVAVGWGAQGGEGESGAAVA
ncbi:MAG: hypothetical protein LBO20_05175, partial [Bifidobacteriaceae bacterium]|nr:hypothetical protein [Bifidobacteriaceae bacterium]